MSRIKNIAGIIRRILLTMILGFTVLAISFGVFKYFSLKANGRYAMGRTFEIYSGAYSQSKVRYEYFVEGKRYEGVIDYRSAMTVPNGFYLVIYLAGSPSVGTLAYSFPLDSAARSKKWEEEPVDPTLINFWNY
jgi:hypothetical protein